MTPVLTSIVTPAGAPVKVGEIEILVLITAEPPPLALSLVVTFGTVPPVAGKLTAGSSIASMLDATATVTVPEQAGAVPVHRGSPPPVTVAVFVPPPAPIVAVKSTETGTVITIGPDVPEGKVQDKLFEPAGIEQPPTAIALLVVIPVGNASAIVIAAVVGPFATFIVMV